MSNYSSKYARILVDDRNNSANDSLQKKITTEEYYDLMHHTHSIDTIMVDEGTMTYGEMQEQVELLNSTVKTQQGLIDSLTETITNLEKLIRNNIPLVSDWDLEKEGRQDIHGNDLGALMGFNITEIQ
jgi:hypothetical protein